MTDDITALIEQGKKLAEAAVREDSYDSFDAHIAHHSPATMLRLCAEFEAKDAEIARLRQAALLAKEALAHSLPVAKHYPEPVERHDTALKAISAALEAHHE